jgi:hypothetical protein
MFVDVLIQVIVNVAIRVLLGGGGDGGDCQG